MEQIKTKQATSRQLWALHLATGEDWRNKNITMEEASRLLDEINKAKGREYVAGNPMIEDFKARRQEIIDRLTEKIIRIAGIESVVEDESPGPDGKKRRWGFVGFGCGFANWDYDKRRKKIDRFVKYVDKCEASIFAAVVRKVPADVKKRMREIGCPIEAVMAQDLEFNNTFKSICCGIAEHNGFELHTRCWYD